MARSFCSENIRVYACSNSRDVVVVGLVFNSLGVPLLELLNFEDREICLRIRRERDSQGLAGESCRSLVVSEAPAL